MNIDCLTAFLTFTLVSSYINIVWNVFILFLLKIAPSDATINNDIILLCNFLFNTPYIGQTEHKA